MQKILQIIQSDVIPCIRAGRFRLHPDPREATASPENFIELALPFPKSHPHYEWTWLIEGSAHMQIENVVHRLEQGDCCLLPPGLSHVDVYDRSTTSYRLLWFNYSIGTMHTSLFDYEPFGQWRISENTYTESVQELGLVLETLRHEMIHREEGAADAITGLLLQLMVRVQRGLSASNSDTYPKLGVTSYEVLRFLMQHFSEPLTLDDIARAVRLSPHYAATKFRQETGMTIFEKLAEIRVEHAVRLLLERQLPLEKIALAVGYKTVDHFSRTFRKVKGTPPSRYGLLADRRSTLSKRQPQGYPKSGI